MAMHNQNILFIHINSSDAEDTHAPGFFPCDTEGIMNVIFLLHIGIN